VRFLLDQGLPRSSVAVLRAAGHDADHVSDLGMSRSTDASILEAAARRSAIVVTLDSDFHALLAVSGRSSPSVVRTRIEGLGGVALARLLLEVIGRTRRELEDGAAVSVTPERIRVRALPIGG